jgi:hypothetical protein
LIVVEPDAALAEGFTEDGVFGAEVINDLLQFPVGIAGENAGKQVPRLEDEFHRGEILQRWSVFRIGPSEVGVKSLSRAWSRAAQLQSMNTVIGRLN